MSKKNEKIDLKTPDAFHTTSDKIFHWIERHAQTVGLAVGGVIILSLGWIAYGYLDARRETAAAEALFAPEVALRKTEERLHEERAKQTTGLAAKPRAANFQADFGPTVDALEVKVREHAGTKVALVSAMLLSRVLINEKQYARALAALEMVTYRPRGSDMIGGLWSMHRGLALLENEKFADAAGVYRSILDQKALDALHPEALLKLGVAQQLGGDVATARQTFEKVARDFPGTEASASAGQSLRLLDLQGKKG